MHRIEQTSTTNGKELLLQIRKHILCIFEAVKNVAIASRLHNGSIPRGQYKDLLYDLQKSIEDEQFQDVACHFIRELMLHISSPRIEQERVAYLSYFVKGRLLDATCPHTDHYWSSMMNITTKLFLRLQSNCLNKRWDQLIRHSMTAFSSDRYSPFCQDELNLYGEEDCVTSVERPITYRDVTLQGFRLIAEQKPQGCNMSLLRSFFTLVTVTLWDRLSIVQITAYEDEGLEDPYCSLVVFVPR